MNARESKAEGKPPATAGGSDFLLPSRFERYVKIFRALALVAISLVILSSSDKMIRSPLAKGDVEVYLHAAGLIVQGEEIYPSSRPAGQVRF